MLSPEVEAIAAAAADRYVRMLVRILPPPAERSDTSPRRLAQRLLRGRH